MDTENRPELRVARTKGMQRATFDAGNATGNATNVQPDSLKALARKVLERNSNRNNNATNTGKQCNNRSKRNVLELRGSGLSIRRVWAMLQNIHPYRICGAIAWRNEPTPIQRQLLREHERELIDLLTPRTVTQEEEIAIGLWLHDIGEHTKPERDHVLALANSSPADRVALLWMAAGSPVE